MEKTWFEIWFTFRTIGGALVIIPKVETDRINRNRQKFVEKAEKKSLKLAWDWAAKLY